MNNPFYLSLFAGLSTVLGTIFLFIKFKNEHLLIGMALSFAAGVMLCVSIIDLIPTAFIDLQQFFYVIPTIVITVIFIIVGIIISIMSNKLFYYDNSIDNNRLYKTGIFSMIAIILHNIPEGIATFLTATTDIRLGINLAIAIAMHNIPEGISISIPIYYSTNSKLKAIAYTFVAGIAEFLGSIIAFLFLSNINMTCFLIFLYLIISGIMISLVIDELIPTALQYLKLRSVFLGGIVGFIFMFIIKILL